MQSRYRSRQVLSEPSTINALSLEPSQPGDTSARGPRNAALDPVLAADRGAYITRDDSSTAASASSSGAPTSPQTTATRLQLLNLHLERIALFGYSRKESRSFDDVPRDAPRGGSPPIPEKRVMAGVHSDHIPYTRAEFDDFFTEEYSHEYWAAATPLADYEANMENLKKVLVLEAKWMKRMLQAERNEAWPAFPWWL